MPENELIQTPAQTEAQTQTPTAGQVKGTPVWLMLALIMLFPPAAWYLMWKEKKYHIWFAWSLVINGGMAAALAFSQLAFVMPKLMSLYDEVKVEVSPLTRIAPLFLISLGLGEVGFGAYLAKKIKTVGEMPKKFLYPALGVLVANLLAGAWIYATSVISIVIPLYSLTSQL